MIVAKLVCSWVSSVPVDCLGLLLGREVLDGLGDVLDFGERSLTCKVLAPQPSPTRLWCGENCGPRRVPRGRMGRRIGNPKTLLNLKRHS